VAEGDPALDRGDRASSAAHSAAWRWAAGVAAMLAVVLFESLLGNTRHVAEAIAGGVRDAHPGTAVRCGTATEVGTEAPAADLLVVGAPTHFFGLPGTRSRRRTRSW
jgi:flavorubredoxin